jgi:hypothetical protein
MKKIITLCIFTLLITSGFGLITTSADDTDDPIATHNVFGEYGTATWCGYCKYAHGALKELYIENQLDFYYVSLVDDKNSVAEARIDEYNIAGFPTVWWDGGYEVDVGAGSIPSAKSSYTSSINSCGSRSVNNVNINLDATWLGGTNMQIDCTVYNYEPETYDGTIRVYITDIASSEGWTDTNGDLYTFAFLDYAFDEDISIPSGSSWSDSTSWSGSSHGYSSMTEDNTMLYAAVFDDELHQGYSDPPTGNPFDAYYVDDCVEHRVGSNQDPYTPSNPDPEDGEVDVELDVTLSWDGGDPDWFDSVSYDVYFEADDSTPDVKVSNNQEETTYDPGTLDLETTYYWQIEAQDNNGGTSTSPVWSFTTRGNEPPETPSNPYPADGATDVSLNADLSWDCSDPNGDDLTYDVYFGTSSNPPLVSSGQSSDTYNPGTMDMTTTYYWKIVAEDSFNEIATGPIWSFTTRGNMAPYTPSNPDPENGATDVSVFTDLSWSGGDPDGDPVVYDVYFGTSSNPPLVSNGQSAETYDPGELDLETKYYWKIVAEDSFDETTAGPLWSFTTRGNNPPYAPSNPDPADGQGGVPINPTLDWDGGDPDEDSTFYDVYLDQNPNPTTLVSEHQTKTSYDTDVLEFEATYYWKIVAEDAFGEITEGPIWSFTVRPEQQMIPDLQCEGSLRWSDIEPGSTVSSTFKVKNVGEATSELYWRITEYPEWGTWTITPNQGSGLKPEDPHVEIQVTVVVPEEGGQTYTGDVKVINLNDESDFENVPVNLNVPRTRNRSLFDFMDILENLIQRLPLLERILEILFR